MASLKEIKTRIGSVQNTRKITSAMKMVASSKLHHAQVMIENMLPYENMLESILKTFLAADIDARGVITEERDVKKVALLVFSSNSSMCGGFNSNIVRRMTHLVEEYKAKGIDVEVYPIGRKVYEKTVKLGYLSVVISMPLQTSLMQENVPASVRNWRRSMSPVR